PGRRRQKHKHAETDCESHGGTPYFCCRLGWCGGARYGKCTKNGTSLADGYGSPSGLPSKSTTSSVRSRPFGKAAGRLVSKITTSGGTLNFFECSLGCTVFNPCPSGIIERYARAPSSSCGASTFRRSVVLQARSVAGSDDE